MTDEQKYYRRLGRFMLKRWRYYELNIGRFQLYNDKRSATVFFKTLQQFNREDVMILASRYYIMPTENYNEYYSCFEVCRALNVNELAVKRNESEKDVRKVFGTLEEKFGETYFNLKKGA